MLKKLVWFAKKPLCSSWEDRGFGIFSGWETEGVRIGTQHASDRPERIDRDVSPKSSVADD